MVWLVTHMWMTLAGAAFLGLVFGWSFRGVLLKGKAVRAAVDRDVAQTELAQAKDEIDRLYAAQRNGSVSEVGTDDSTTAKLRTDIEEREAKLKSLTDELARSKEAIEELKSSAGSGASAIVTGAAALAGAGVATAASDSGNEPERLDAGLNQEGAALEWRNRYLESRVRSLETEVHVMGKTAASDVVATPVMETTSAETEEETPAQTDGDEPPEQELARLRWRNRYLEGRVAYHEGGLEEAEANDSKQNGSNGHGGLAAAGAAVVAGVATKLASGDDNSADEATETDAMEETPDADVEKTEDTAADAVLRAMEKTEAEEVESVKPDTLDSPRGKSGDDLTVIGGIGPKIQDVLHGMGVYHYDQISEWSVENTAWVDQQLSFSGRIDREEWVSQAKALIEKADAEN